MAITIDGADNKLEIGANATGPSSLRLYEDTDNGTNYVSIIAPSAVTSNRTITLPDATGTLLTAASTPAFASTIGVGGATPAASGAGITFPATQSASSDANTLDDYEEGTFTPTLSSGFSVAPTSYTYQLGRYTKIGRLVYFEIDIDPNGATASAASISFGGLPFTAAATPYSAVTLGYQSSFNTNTGDTLIVDVSATTVGFYSNAGTNRAGNSANVNINNRIIFSGCYVV